MKAVKIGAILLAVTLIPFAAFGAGTDKLIVKDSGGTTNVFSVTDSGTVLTADYYNGQSDTPGFWLDELDGTKGVNFVLDGGTMQVQRRASNFGAFEASIFRIKLDAPAQSFVIQSTGYIGFGTATPAYPIDVQTANGAHVTTGGTWTNASSREYKENITELSAEEAFKALEGLTPVEYNYKKEKDELYVGFIAEDVPELVAQKDRKSLSPMDIVGVLTKVVKEQQKTIDALQKRLDQIDR